MDEVQLKIDHEHSESSDISRDEMKWNSKNQDLLLNWSLKCEKASKTHGIKAKKFKKFYVWFGLPSVLIPIAIGILQPHLKEYELMISMLMLLSASFSGVATFFDFSRKRSKHLDSENNYNSYFSK